MTMAQTST